MDPKQRLALLGGMVGAANFFGEGFPAAVFRRLLREEADARPAGDPLGATLREMAGGWDAARFLAWRERHGGAQVSQTREEISSIARATPPPTSRP